MMTPKEVRKLWVEALRSGKYKQGRGRLRTGDSYCCLGVLCELAIDNGLNLTREILGDFTRYHGEVSTDVSSSILPHVVADWAGLQSYDGMYDGIHTLASRNDGGYTFQQIADIIESEPHGLLRTT